MKRVRSEKALPAVLLLVAFVGATAISVRVPGAHAQRSDPDNKPALEFTVKRGGEETKVSMYYGSGVYKFTATDTTGTRDVNPLRPGTQLTAACDAKQQICKRVKIEGGGTIKICVCKAKEGTTALLLPAVQKVREAAGGGGGGGGGGCTTEKPCCYEDQKLQMSICYP